MILFSITYWQTRGLHRTVDTINMRQGDGGRTMIERNLQINAEGFSAPLPARNVAFSTFTDVEVQAGSFVGWSLDYTQMSSGAFQGSSSEVSLGAIRLWVERLNRVILQRGTAPSDSLTVAVPLELEGHSRMCGQMSERNSLHVFSSLPEFEFYSPDRHALVVVEIDEHALSTESLRELAMSLRINSRSPIVPMENDTAESMRDLLRNIFAASANSVASRDDDTNQRLYLIERTVLFSISEVLNVPGEKTGKLTTKSMRSWALVNAVQAQLQDPATCPLSIAELCVRLNISRRTIQYAFHEALDSNPVSYLRAVRLNHVRRALRTGLSVTSAATKWGFWHLSSFAQDYRTMFGELPSSTSKRFAKEIV